MLDYHARPNQFIIEIPGSECVVHIICVHLGLFERERQNQLAVLAKRIKSHIPEDEPLIIAGDFNDWRSRAERHLHEDLGVKEAYKTTRGAHARTFPAWFPVLSMDRIYYRGIEVNDCHRLHGQPWSRLSDHTPLLAEFSIHV